MAKLDLTDITSNFDMNAYNANNALIEAAVENTLSRDGTTPNQMAADLDMNSNDINNIQDLRATNFYLNGVKVSGVYPEDLQELGALSDVELTAEADTEFLRYDIATGNWINAPLVSADITAFEDDITISVAQVSDFDPSNYLLNTTDTLVGDLSVEGDVDIGVNAGGDSILNFYDDTNNVNRQIFWDDSEGAFYFEDSSGVFNLLGSGGIEGAITAGQIAYGDGVDSIAGIADFTYTAGTTATLYHGSTNGPVFRVDGGDPQIFYREADGGTDQKNWLINITGGNHNSQVNNDANTVGYIWQQVVRGGSGAGVQANSIEWNAANNIDFNTAIVNMDARLDIGTGANATALVNTAGTLDMYIENGGNLTIRDGNTSNQIRFDFDIDTGDMQMDGNLDLAYIDAYAGTPADGQVLTWVTANSRAEFAAAAGGGESGPDFLLMGG